ncbi:S8 family peptidase [Candidatus Woesearchaeota archaeon]|nr:S8 family peptidase [Candidatus Woesearchaeota archaeon]
MKNSQVKLGTIIIGLILASLLVVAVNSAVFDNGFDKVVKENKHKFNLLTADFLESLDDEYQSNDFIIKYNDDFDKNNLDKFSKVGDIEKFKISKFKAKVKDLEDIIQDDSVELVELDQDLLLLGEYVPFNIQQVNADSVWNLSTGNGVKVAVLDTGIASHLDLSIAGGWNVVDDSSDYSDSNGHGTMIAGVLSALLDDNGLVGVSPDASLYAVKIMEGSSGSLSDAISGVEWVLDNDMDVVSMSFGFDGYSQIFKEVVEDAYDEGILLVGASGNDDSSVVYPAAYTSVVAVGAVDEDNIRAGFSNYGFELELVAPGVSINSTTLNDGYSEGTGTSLAVPHVAGVAALIWSYNRNLTNEQVRGKLQNDALDFGSSGKDDYFGYGLVVVNLSSADYNFSEDTYYYEVYNITDYGLENESYEFWLSDNGTIDDVDFSEGYYLINKTINGSVISEKIFVDENRTVYVLIMAQEYKDYFDGSYKGTQYDEVLWVDGDLDVRMSGGQIDSVTVECYDDPGTSSIFEVCYYEVESEKIACNNLVGEMDCGGDTECYVRYIGAWHSLTDINLVDTSAVMKKKYDGIYFLGCSPPVRGDTGPELWFYVINKKRAHCVNSTHYVYPGWSGSDWVDYGDYYSCGGFGCNSSLDDIEKTNSEDTIPSPCNAGAQTDLEVLDVVVIQTVKDVTMIKGKSGIIRVRVRNNGNSTEQNVQQARVNLTAPSLQINSSSYQIKPIDAGEIIKFDWWFKPIQTGTDVNISANVEILG